MKKLIWFTIVTVIFLVFIAPGLLALGIKMVPDADQPGYNPDQRISIYGIRQVSQKFISLSNNLTAIGTSIRNPNLKNKKDIILSLYDKDKNLVRTSTLNGQNVQDGNFIRFVFDPIPESKGKTYSFTLASPDAGPEESIEVFIINMAPTWIVEYSYDKNVYSGGMPLVTFYKPSSHLQVVKEVYANLFARLLR